MSDETTAGEWQECLVDSDYEIWSQYPYPIRRKGTDRLVSECVDSHGYLQCRLNGKLYLKHRIVAIQFIPNIHNLPQVDHINHNRSDNHISNLRWISNSGNSFNRSSCNGVEYEFVDRLNERAIEVTQYNNHRFKFYYYDPEDDSFYFYTGINYRRMYPNIKSNGLAYINAIDTNGRRVNIYYNRFKELYDLMPEDLDDSIFEEL